MSWVSWKKERTITVTLSWILLAKLKCLLGQHQGPSYRVSGIDLSHSYCVCDGYPTQHEPHHFHVQYALCLQYHVQNQTTLELHQLLIHTLELYHRLFPANHTHKNPKHSTYKRSPFQICKPYT